MVLHGRGGNEGRIPEIQAVTGIRMKAAENQASWFSWAKPASFIGEHRERQHSLDRDREKGPEPAAFLPFLKPTSAVVPSAGK